MDLVKVAVSVKTDKVRSLCKQVIEYNREYWDSMTEKEKEEDLFQEALTMFAWDYEVMDNEER